jgi:hypothetical protein
VVGWPCHPVVVPAAVLPAPRLPRAHLAACRCLCRRLCRPRHPLCHPCTPPPIAPSQWPLPPPVSLRRPTISCLLRQLPLRQLPPTPGLALQFKFEFVSFAARRFHQQSHSATPRVRCISSCPSPCPPKQSHHRFVPSWEGLPPAERQPGGGGAPPTLRRRRRSTCPLATRTTASRASSAASSSSSSRRALQPLLPAVRRPQRSRRRAASRPAWLPRRPTRRAPPVPTHSLPARPAARNGATQ